MNRKLAIIIGLQAFLIVMLFWVLVFYGKDEYEALNQDNTEQIETPNHVTSKQGVAIVTVSTETQNQSDIKTNALKASSYHGGINSYGDVIGIDGLIELRTRYLAAKAESEVISASLTHNQNEYNRLLALNQDDKNVSDKVVATALADTKSDEAKLSATESSAKSIADSVRQAWGESLSKLALEKNMSPLLQNLVTNKEALLQITLPYDSPEPAANSHVVIGIPETQYSGAAYYLSPAPVSNASIQGKTYFYHLNSSILRSGMKVTVLNLNNTQSNIGVLIPATAVVWYGGKPWVYKKTSDDEFTRIPINTDTEVQNGWFYQGKLKAGDQIVTSGAQLLLSEEFKSQITNENED
jgi:membrane fusion protein, multidrug efflux system